MVSLEQSCCYNRNPTTGQENLRPLSQQALFLSRSSCTTNGLPKREMKRKNDMLLPFRVWWCVARWFCAYWCGFYHRYRHFLGETSNYEECSLSRYIWNSVFLWFYFVLLKVASTLLAAFSLSCLRWEVDLLLSQAMLDIPNLSITPDRGGRIEVCLSFLHYPALIIRRNRPFECLGRSPASVFPLRFL